MRSHDDLLARELQARSEQMTATSIELGAVKARARRIRHRRQAVTGTVAAAVLAIAVPVGITVTDAARTEPLPPVAQTQTAKPAGPIPADGAAAPRGADPAIAYVEDGRLVTAEGAQLDLGGSYGQVTPYAGGWLASRLDTGTTYVLDATAEVVETWPGDDIAVSPSGDFVATVLYATGGIDLQLRPSTGTDSPLSHTVAFEGTVDIVGFVGPEEVVYAHTGPRGRTEVYVTDFLHEARRLDGALAAAGANVATGLVSVMTSVDELEPGSCWAVVRPDGTAPLWETCDYTIERFSPDGRYVIGTDAYHDGIGGSTVAILDASDGSVLAHFTTRDLGFTSEAVWETDSSVLLTTYQGDAWYLLRLLPGGTVEQALDPVRAGEMTRPWDLPPRP